MKLDPRIRSKEDILTPFDTDKAKQFIGEECFFTGTIKRFADNYFAKPGFVFRGILTQVNDTGDYPFIRGGQPGGALTIHTPGGPQKVNCAPREGVFRIIQAIPSPKAEPFKRWMAQVASQRIDQMQDPELSIDQAIADYQRLGYSEAWINQRIKSIEVRKELTDEWKRTGVHEGMEYALLTDIITQEWSGFTTKQYKHYKGLKKENLRDNMTNVEIALNTLAEASATELSKQRDPKGYKAQRRVAKDGGSVAKAARKQLEGKLGRSVISSTKASDYLLPDTTEEPDTDD